LKYKSPTTQVPGKLGELGRPTLTVETWEEKVARPVKVGEAVGAFALKVVQSGAERKPGREVVAFWPFV
jgi:hypothetical protein